MSRAERTIFYIGLNGGGCGLTTDGYRDVLRRIGSDRLREFRPATQQEVDWVRSMGGAVPAGRVRKMRKSVAMAKA